MEAVLAYMRLSTSGDFIQLVPRSLHNPGKIFAIHDQEVLCTLSHAIYVPQYFSMYSNLHITHNDIQRRNIITLP